MTDFAKFIAQEDFVHLLKLTIHTSGYYSAEDVCTSTLVEFELLSELKIEKKTVLHCIHRVIRLRQA
jgi:hypothetical protein